MNDRVTIELNSRAQKARLGVMTVPIHRGLTPDEREKVDAWLRRAFKGVAGPSIDSVSFGGVIRVDREKNEPPAHFRKRVEDFIDRQLINVRG